jgi:arginine exporter protein ArgO
MGGGIMSAFNIAFLMLGWFASVVWFYTLGVNTGYIEGRKAVRKFYEQRDKVRA